MKGSVVVVGAGVIGCATALELARRGWQTTLLERGTVAAGVSGASLAAITAHLAGPPEELPFVLEATSRWKTLAAELRTATGIDVEFEVCGHVKLVESGDEAAVTRLAELVDAERAAGLDVRLLPASELTEVLPALRPGVAAAASWCPGDAKLNPLLACRALAAAATRAGADIRTRCRVLELREAGRWDVVTSAGTVAADAVVLAAGGWAPFLLDGLHSGLTEAIEPRRAQCCVTGRLQPVIDPIVSSFSVGVGAGYTQLHQTRHGEVLFNTVVPSPDPRAQSELDVSVQPEFLTASAQTLLRLFPTLATARLLRSWAACEAWTPDGRLVIGEIPGRSGLLVASGDCGTGFLRAPLVAFTLAELLDQPARSEAAWPAYSPARFGPLEALTT